MRAVEISVTADRIDRGRARNCEECAVALGICAAFPKATEVHVWGRRTTIVFPGDLAVDVDLPETVVASIRRLDQAEPVEPFTFTMQIPEEVAA